ncbi:hypothetical protein NPX13_g995 [Xylaria arbuscula]|uniref:DUF3074 domain-containing protein n=1 Tax=Xylaria arbuscula TaxID=114810 RepID=A0A9W8TRN5_9PEZI|nr:hypothetical protein NPX13_g995 [Xylaria arbuscula]
MSSTSRETFKALGPVEWEAFAQDDPTIRMPDIFNDAHCLIDSIPSPSDDNSMPTQPAEYLQRSRELRKEWKEVRINPRDNPFGLNVYKMAAKDGRGAWFARRSIHTGQSFTKWKTGIEREFSESLKVQGQPGDGKIRGLGADKCVVDQTVDGCGKMQVYQLSAQFPGPTTPRDFVTLCLSSDTAMAPATKKGNQPREYILVSKPCVHTECPERSGFIRGYYESVELIREVKTEGPLQNTPSSTSAASNDPPSVTSRSNNISEDSATSNAQLDGQSDESKSSKGGDCEENISTIEWIMVTRSDPGGSVPRFIIEKKTPEGIVTDAGKFVQWVSSEEFETLLNNNFESTPTKAKNTPGGITSEGLSSISQAPLATAGSAVPLRTTMTAQQEDLQSAWSPGPSGVYGMISSALSMVASAAASRLYRSPLGRASPRLPHLTYPIPHPSTASTASTTR